MAFAVYKFPDSNQVTLIKGRVEREFQNDSFVIQNFSTGEIFSIRKEITLTATSFNELADQFVKEAYLRPEGSVKISSESDHFNTIESAIEEIEKGIVKKIVIGANRRFSFNANTIAAKLDALAQAFPECLIHCYSSPFTGTWFGASPEKLLVKNQNEFVTMALAGTIKSESEVSITDFGSKEQEEQHLVEQFMVSVFESATIKFEKTSPFVFKTGQLHHLCTDFKLQLKDNSIPSVLKQLHPTPAVCGLPRKEADHFIKSEEKFLRECYTGYIGDSTIHNYYVNLRCGQLTEDSVVLYAGGGINKGSDAKKELAEVENKITNLSRFLVQ